MNTLAVTAARSMHSRNTLAGIACGVGAGALWGFAFLGPELAGDFSPLLLTIGRYLGFGLLAAALLAPRWREVVAHVSGRQWRALAWLAVLGHTGYYLLMSSAVQLGGIAMTSIVLGFTPVTVTLIGSRERGAVPLSRLLPSLLLCVAGATCIGWEALARPVAGASGRSLLGLLSALGALAAWTAYAVGNARWLVRLQQVSAHDWNLLTGLVAGAQTLLLLPLALVVETAHHAAAAWLRFGAISLGVVVLASILGNSLWNRMSRLLPLTLVGQMILFETLFALFYGLLWEWRWPAPLETAALLLLAAGVSTCLAAHRRRAQAPSRATGDACRIAP